MIKLLLSQAACLLTGSKPCVQAVEKLCLFFPLSVDMASVFHTLLDLLIIPSDFSSRNAAECTEPRCPICTFITLTEDSVVCGTSVQDVRNFSRLPFAIRSALREIQQSVPTFVALRAYLKQGTRLSKKVTNIKDVKKYLNVASIAKDGLLVVPRTDPLSHITELVIVPRSALDGLDGPNQKSTSPCCEPSVLCP